VTEVKGRAAYCQLDLNANANCTTAKKIGYSLLVGHAKVISYIKFEYFVVIRFGVMLRTYY